MRIERNGNNLLVYTKDGRVIMAYPGGTLYSAAGVCGGADTTIFRHNGNDLIVRAPDGVESTAYMVSGGWLTDKFSCGDFPPSSEWFWPFPLSTFNENNGAPEDGFRTPQRPNHNAIDMGYGIANITGTPIKPASSGVVLDGWRSHWSFGNRVVIDHGNYYTTYNHMFQPAYVSAGQSVTPETVLGGIGTTGNSTGNHLHFEIFDLALGDYVNPHIFMAEHNPEDNVVP